MHHLYNSLIPLKNHLSKKSPTGPTERTPKKPEYLMQFTKRGPLGFGPIQFLMEFLTHPSSNPLTKPFWQNHSVPKRVQHNSRMTHHDPEVQHDCWIGWFFIRSKFNGELRYVQCLLWSLDPHVFVKLGHLFDFFSVELWLYIVKFEDLCSNRSNMVFHELSIIKSSWWFTVSIWSLTKKVRFCIHWRVDPPSLCCNMCDRV